jgi:hypothetical protein
VSLGKVNKTVNQKENKKNRAGGVTGEEVLLPRSLIPSTAKISK